MKLILHWPLASRHKQWSSWGQQLFVQYPDYPQLHSAAWSIVIVRSFIQFLSPPSWAWPPATSGAGSPLKFSANLLTSPSPLIGSSPACVRMLGSSAHVLNNNERKFRVKTPLSSLLLLRTKSLVWTIIVPARGPLPLPGQGGHGLISTPICHNDHLLSHPQWSIGGCLHLIKIIWFFCIVDFWAKDSFL